jgi:hypothetical protein
MLNSFLSDWKGEQDRYLGVEILKVWGSGLALLGLLLLTGCASTGTPEELANRLRELSPAVDHAEANTAAETACSYSRQLRKDYKVIPPAHFQNMLVNMGVRQRGLCFQWADDLAAKLESLHLRSLDLHRGVARLDTRHEHSSVVLTAPRQPFDTGIVLDAWRHSGHLVWAGVKEDKYPWVEIFLVPDDPPPPIGKNGR